MSLTTFGQESLEEWCRWRWASETTCVAFLSCTNVITVTSSAFLTLSIRAHFAPPPGLVWLAIGPDGVLHFKLKLSCSIEWEKVRKHDGGPTNNDVQLILECVFSDVLEPSLGRTMVTDKPTSVHQDIADLV